MIHAPSYAKSSAIHAVVRLADGTIEDLGLIAYWHKNAALNWAVNFYIRLKDFINGRSRPK